MGRGKRMRLAEQRRQESLVRMSVVSASPVQSDNALSMAAEVQHCHAALLYGDEVTLISPRSAILKSVADTNAYTGANLVRLTAELAPYLAPDNIDAMKIARALVDFPKKALVTAKLRKQHADLVDSMLASVNSGQEKIVENARGVLAKSGFDQLQVAIDAGLLSVDDVQGADIAAFATRRTDAAVSGFLGKIQEVLSSGNQYPLFDAGVSEIVRTGVEAGIFTRVPMSRRHGSDAAMASGLFDFLPSFPHAKTSEILDIRRALDGPLKNFRLGVRELTKNIDADAGSPEFGNEIEDCWNLIVRPALDELDDLIRENSSLRDLLARGVREGASLPGLTAAATLGATHFGVAAGPATTLPLAAGAAVGMSYSAVRAFLGQGEALREATGTKFYFLYGTNERLRLAS